MNIRIVDVFAREVIDSRGTPTVEAEVHTEFGFGRAIVPSGASCGTFEASEKRDGEKERFFGKGVLRAVESVNGEIKDCLVGMNVLDQRAIDKELIKLDGTPNKERLGANAILAVSLAAAHAAADSLGISFYRYVGGANAHIMPVPMMNILNGGAHANNNVDIQEFMIMPIGAKCFREGLTMCCEVYQSLKKLLNKSGAVTAVGDEGGFAPNLSSDEKAIELIISAVEDAGYRMKHDFVLALDAAGSEWVSEGGGYLLPKSNIKKTTDELIEYWADLAERFPIYSIEDPLGEEDWEGWQKLTQRLGGKIQLVGDDLFVTNTKRLKKGIEKGAANAILVKVNQIGTLTEALEATEEAQKRGYRAIISHRSGETEDTTIADIAVATNAGQIKCGAPARCDRTAKYNRLLRIEQELCFTAEYGVM
ncbi:MAG: phosphopyruvate hydratase [Clostridia bacterium]|nr:phosphopyruvate hydratase [Clostridia bacterium]